MKVFVFFLHNPSTNACLSANVLIRVSSTGCTLRGLVALGTLANIKIGRDRILKIGGAERVKIVVERADPDGDVRSIGNEVLDVLGVGAVDELELD